MALAPGTRLGPYEVVAQIGVGGMGEVYKATDTNLKRAVAIKVLPASVAGDPDRLARFQREAEVLASLNHPNIAAIYGLERSGATTALVMELVEGSTLADRIAQGAVPVDEALPIAKQIAEGLEAAHELGIIHRDLKPANIKVRADGTVKVLDFGLAKAMEPTIGSSPSLSMSPTITTPAMTQAGMILGTAAYMSPEQARGKTVDRRADIWALGAVLFEMLTGERAFPGEDLTDTLAVVVKLEPRWEAVGAGVPARVRQVLRVCLQKDPRHRAQAIGDVRLALEGAFETTISQVTTSATSPPPRGPLAWTAFAVAAVVAVALAVPAVRHLRESAPAQQNVRFQITPPPNTRFTTFRLSPDGRYVAYLAASGPSGGAGQGELWIRAFDSLDSRIVPGSDGSSYPFWSPDSGFIGFFQGGKLKKVAVTGGPAQTICDVADSRGGAWGPDGTILFSDGPARPIFRVSSSGGKPVQVTKLTGGDPGEGHRSPEFLPDGQHFLFNATANTPDNVGTLLGSLDGSTPIRLLPDDSNGIFEQGHLFFLRAGTLMALPFDTARRQATAEAFPVAENVGIAANNRYGAFSLARNGTLAYWRGEGGMLRSGELVWMDRSGKQLGALGEPKVFGRIALSPDEKTVAATVGPPLETDVWLLDSTRGSTTRFTFGFSGSNPAWSTDGKTILYSRRSGVTNDIVRRAITGGADELLLPKVVNAAPTGVSSDGTFVVYEMSVARTAYDIGLLSADGDHGESTYLGSQASEREPRVSPDGKWMAYQSDESGQYQVYVQTIPAGGAKFQMSAAGGVLPAWRHDGNELYYLDPDQKLMAVPITINGTSFAPGTPKALFTAPGASNFVVTRDGQRFLMNVPAGGELAATGPPLTVVTNWQAGLKR